MSVARQTVKRAETRLNAAVRTLESETATLDIEIRELMVQVTIFQYDVCAEMSSFLYIEPSGFATSVALKGLVLRLFEYDLVLNKHLIPRLLALARARNVPISRESVKSERKKWKSELRTLSQWADVRNRAAGHYDKNVHDQVRLLRTLTSEGVMRTADAFLRFNMGLIKMFCDAGE